MSASARTPEQTLLRKLLKQQQTLSRQVLQLTTEKDEQKQEILRLKRKSEENRDEEGKNQEKQLQAKAQKLSLKVPQPPPFEGNNKVNVDIWLFEVQQYFDLVQVPSEQRVAWVGTLLRESAATWWSSAVIEKRLKLNLTTPNSDSATSAAAALVEATTAPANSASTTATTTVTTTASLALDGKRVQDLFTWHEFVELLRKRYMPHEAALTARAKLSTLQQFKLSGIEAYNTEFQRQMALIHDMSVADQIEYYQRGLLSDVKKDVMNKERTSLMDAMNTATRSSAIALATKSHAHVGAGSGHSGASAQAESEVNAIQLQHYNEGAGSLGRETMESPLLNSSLNYLGTGAFNSYSYRGGRGMGGSGMNSRGGQGFFRNRDEGERLMRENRCFYCKQEGHVARFCPKKRGGGYGRGRGFASYPSRGSSYGSFGSYGNAPQRGRGNLNYRARSE